MHYYEVAPNKIVRSGSDHFTYHSEEALEIGTLVSIEIGKKVYVGVIMRRVTEPSYKTKPVKETISSKPLPQQLLKLSVWLSQYYSTPLANSLQAILPTGVYKKRRKAINKQGDAIKRKRTLFLLNEEQRKVMEDISRYADGTFLLHGITGSGKTTIYIQLIKQAIENGQSAIVIVPEIALTSQLIGELSNHFNNLLITHSKMTESARHSVWTEALTSDSPQVVVGPRSALFMPLNNIGVIVIDESQEPSLKQDQSPKYSALRAATILGRFHKAKVVFGSATPNIVDRYLAEKSDRPVLELLKLATPDSVAPDIISVDMKKRDNFTKSRIISNQLIAQIEKTLSVGEQVLIFHNRRGSASITLCEECGWSAECPRCFLPLVLHGDSYKLKCHVCGHEDSVPTSCPACGHAEIIHKGVGTKLIEAEVSKLFPNASMARFDADNPNDQTINARYQELYDGKIDIIIGTQIVAKGLDLPHLRLVGIIQADAGLSLPDFSSTERTFQLLAQVVGRVGRTSHPTTVIAQSYRLDHPSVRFGLTQDYENFYNFTLEERKKSAFPPFIFLAKLSCSYKTEATAIKNSKELAYELKRRLGDKAQILGPTPCFHERKFGTYQWQIILKSPRREYLIEALRLLPPKNWQADLDPNNLI